MEVLPILALTLIMSLCAPGGDSTKFTIRNNCPFKVWPAIIYDKPEPHIPTGFELASKANFSFEIPNGWASNIWGRTKCSITSQGIFKCETGDCGTGKLQCVNFNYDVSPASRVELGVVQLDGNDYYNINLLDGFNLPLSLTPLGTGGNCTEASCRSNINSVCPKQLAVKGSDGNVVLCKSPCFAYKTPESCCTDDYNDPNKCMISEYTKIIAQLCPLARSSKFDPNEYINSFTCSGKPNYVLTFCP